jgi:hypothetical protein
VGKRGRVKGGKRGKGIRVGKGIRLKVGKVEGPRVRKRVKGGGKEGKGMDEGRRLRIEKGGKGKDGEKRKS